MNDFGRHLLLISSILITFDIKLTNNVLTVTVTAVNMPPTDKIVLFARSSAQLWQYRDKKKPEIGTMAMPYSYRMTSRVLYSAQY